jgi:hypothetical protein
VTDEIAKPLAALSERPAAGAPRRHATRLQAFGAVALGVALVLALAGGLAVWRLSQGPVGAAVFAPAVERLLASQVRGGRAHVQRAEITWSRPSATLGLALQGVSLRDGRGRPVLAARRLEFGWALDSLLALRPSAGRVGAQDFYAAVSVSPEGRYGLGWDASGAPRGRGDLVGLVEDLTGKARRSRPLSYLRDVEIANGVVDLRQVGAPLAWRGQVQQVRFRKQDRRLDAAADLTVGEGQAAAALKVRGRGSVGLDQADAQAWLAGLNPSRVFPSVGPTRALSGLDAQVDGRAQLAYAARRGLRAADVQLTAGEGRVRFGRAFEPFHAAEFRAVFDPRTQSIADRLLISASRADLDLGGQARLIPESRQTGPASLVFSLQGRQAALLLADQGDKQPLHDIDIRARFTPARGRLEIDQARALVGAAPIDARGVLLRGKPGRPWGVELDGHLNGWAELPAVLALWPDRIGDGARKWVVQHIRQGRAGQIAYRLRLPPNGLPRGRPLANDWVHVDFAVQGGEVRIRDDMPVIQQADAHAVLQGDRFDLQLTRALMNGVTLSRGVITLPRLSGEGQRYDIQVNGAGDLRKVVELVDAPAGHVLTRQGMPPAGFAGQSEVVFTIGRPLGRGYGDDFRNYDISYKGVVRQARMRNATLGLDLDAPLIRVEGGEDQLTAKGDVRLGPYRGPLDFNARFGPGQPMIRRAVLKGRLDMSSVGLGGPAGSSMPFSGRFESRNDTGQGVVTSRGFTGKADWRQGPGGRILVQGRFDPAAWRAIGVPVAKAMPDKTPARLELRRTAAGWNGALEAGVYSGAITLAGGPPPRLRYVAELSPSEARELGLSASPAFTRPQPMVIEVAAREGSGQASYAVGPMKGQVSWLTQAGGRTQYRWRAALSEADLHAIGLPASISPRGPLNVDLAMTGVNGGWSGTVQVSGANLRFTAQPAAGGRRVVSFAGPLDGSAIDLLGVLPPGSVEGPLTASGQFSMDARGVMPGRLDLDLTRASLASAAAGYRKPAGRPLRVLADFSRNVDGSIQAGRLHAEGSGVAIEASGLLRPSGVSTIDAKTLRVDGVYDGSLQLAADRHGRTIVARGRFFDARPLIHDLVTPRTGGAGKGGIAAQPGAVRLDLDIGQVRISDRTTLKDLHAIGTWAEPSRRRLDVSAATSAGSAVSVHIAPDPGGGLINAKITNVADVADSLLGVGGFAGGSATVHGSLKPDGADFEVEMRNVRLVRAPMLAQILTMGSLRGMADTLNGEGISFSRVNAPMRLRGSRLTIADARAVGGSLGLTGKGFIDLDRRTMDLAGAIAPGYGLNSMIGAVPLVGQLLVSKKGEGVFGVTYSAKGSFAQPKVSVNPFSLAAPGILRRMFEGRPSAERDDPPRPMAAVAVARP